ncbi:MAG: RIP metalloprotease RseP [Thermodesulfobacteriota bacterium]
MQFFFYYILPFAVVLGVLIFFHELGHFLTAKYFGVKVLKFSLGFGPKLAGKKMGETEYLISAIPLGGYVKMLGESEEDEAEPLSPEEEEKSFSNKSVGKRIAIVGAGPLFNLALALVIFCASYVVSGIHVMTPEIGQVREDSPAAVAGLQKGDIIAAINGKPIETWEDIKSHVKENEGEALLIEAKRGDGHISVSVIPEMSVVKNLFGEETQSPLIGIVAAGHFKQVSLSPLKAIQEGFKKTWEIIKLTCLTIVKLFQQVVPIKTLGGPILIGQMSGQLAQENWTYLIPFTAVISINLGILNLLPVPILDGGVIIFLFLELITGKPLTLRKREIAQKVGLFLLLMLMAVVIYNDITRLLE